FVSNVTFPHPLGTPVPDGAIFDPASTKQAPNGQFYRDQFPLNSIPVARFDKVSGKIQSLIPQPDNALKIQNFNPTFPTDRRTPNYSVKLDHQLNKNAKISGYFGTNQTRAQYSTNLNQSEGLPGPLTATRGTFTRSYTYRINYDQTLSPTVLFHLGAGIVNYPFNDNAPYVTYDQVAELGLTGASLNGAAGGRFPSISGLNSAAQGGMQGMGPGIGGSQTTSRQVIPTFNTSTTWVKNNHTFKFGSELRLDGWNSYILTGTMGSYTFSAANTAQPYFNTVPSGAATAGFGYASFLLGEVNTVRINEPASVRMGKKQWGFFAQDNWKLTRKLTVDVGIRYDYSLAPREQYGRLPTFDPSIVNASAGGHPGGTAFEATCNCKFSKNYPFAIGPRFGLAYQINNKTVLRGGFGIAYSGTPSNVNPSVNPANTIANPQFGFSVMQFQNGIPASFHKPFPNLSPSAFPTAASPNLGPPVVVDQNGGRPSRQMQWSAGLQREIFRDLVVDASYVGNRGVWWQSTDLVDYNAMSIPRLQSFGLDL
ncbi:MAG: TonB-dependent receptor, partial [Acidobacteriota bacterium]